MLACFGKVEIHVGIDNAHSNTLKNLDPPFHPKSAAVEDTTRFPIADVGEVDWTV